MCVYMLSCICVYVVCVRVSVCVCMCLCVCVCTYIYTRNSHTDTCKLSTTDFEVCMDVLIRMGLGRRMLGCLVFASLLACLVLAALLPPPRFSGARFLSSSLAIACARPSASRVVVLGSCSGARVVARCSRPAVVPCAVLGWYNVHCSAIRTSRLYAHQVPPQWPALHLVQPSRPMQESRPF